MLRMFSRYVEQTRNIPYLHNRKHPPSPGALYRMGIRTRVAEIEKRYGLFIFSR
jgi:hypothetical protein